PGTYLWQFRKPSSVKPAGLLPAFTDGRWQMWAVHAYI
ncbi:MAG: hypothetical protein ACI9W1_003599, partial [Candidatus Azotimanducaceae bacterium]